MPVHKDDLVSALADNYQKLEPLLRYLRARLKYDTTRWLRAYGTKDDIVFATRTKSFARVLEKLNRKGIRLTRKTDLLELALSEKGVLTDLIGIRFICFDMYKIFKLVRYFIATDRMTTSKREFYTSPRMIPRAPIYDYLRSSGFEEQQKEGREYEDINFIVRFAHPIHTYFGSGTEVFQPLAELTGEGEPISGRLRQVNDLFDKLRVSHSDLIRVIPQFPIECQILTATQHIYNRAQRPQYQFVVQRRPEADPVPQELTDEINMQLELLKLNLIAADHAAYAVHRKSGIQYEVPFQIIPGPLFSIAGRLPTDLMEINSVLRDANDVQVPIIIDSNPTNLEREEALEKILVALRRISTAIHERSKSDGDISAYDLLQVGALPSLSHQDLMFWAYQRMALAILAVLLLYTSDQRIIARIVASLKFAATLGDAEKSNYIVTNSDIVIGRLFETLENLDHAVNTTLTARRENGKPIDGWRDGYFTESLFCDPLIQWRYASYMYGNREYTTALEKVVVGTKLLAALAQWKARGVNIPFDVPETVLYERRIVEYELCIEIKKLRIPPGTVAGTLELCNIIRPKVDLWSQRLQRVMDESIDGLECARCFCLDILLQLCQLSAGGLRGGNIGELQDKYRERFDQFRTQNTNGCGKRLEQKSWWLLVTALFSDRPVEPILKNVRRGLGRINHHPIERLQFEEVCESLIVSWRAPTVAPATRRDFSIALLSLIEEQSAALVRGQDASHRLAQQYDEIIRVLKELQSELAEGKSTKSHETIRNRLGRILVEATEKTLAELAVSGIKSVIGY